MNKREALKIMIEGGRVYSNAYMFTPTLHMDEEGTIVSDNGYPIDINDYPYEEWEKEEDESYGVEVKSLKYLSRGQALEQLVKGKKVRHRDWPIGKFLYYDEDGDLLRDNLGDFYANSEWREFKNKDYNWRVIE